MLVPSRLTALMSALGVVCLLVALGSMILLRTEGAHPQGMEAVGEAFGSSTSRRVIVRLRTAAPSADLATPSGLELARATVRRAQDDFLARMIGTDRAKEARWSTRRIELFPMLAMTIGRADVDALSRDKAVAQIWLDEMLQPAADNTLTDLGMLQNPITLEAGAWSAGADGRGTIIAVLDSGVDPTHPYLTGKVVEEACFSTTNAADRTTTLCPNGQSSQIGAGSGRNCTVIPPGNFSGDHCMHGSGLAGIAAGRNPANASPYGGVAKAASIFSVKVYSAYANVSGTGGCAFDQPVCLRAYMSDVLAGLSHVLSRMPALSQPIAAVNLSAWGVAYDDPAFEYLANCDTHPLKPAIDALRSQGVPTVIAAGDAQHRDKVLSPGCISSAVTVAGLEGSTTTIHGFSNMGPSVDMLAYSSGDIAIPTSGGQITGGIGTSLAAAQVSGAFAALKSARPSATLSQIQSALESTGLPITDTRPAIPSFGLAAGTLTRPRIRVNYALKSLEGTLGPILDVVPAAVSFRGPQGGPFVPASQSITVRNSGGQPLSWTATIEPGTSPQVPRIALSAASGTLAPYTSTTITVTPAPGTLSLGEGWFLDYIRFNGSGSQQASVTASVEINNAPINDMVSAAIMLDGASGSTTGTTAFATHETVGGEQERPHFSGTTGNKSVWWTWTAPADGQATFSTAGSAFDTVLAVYSRCNTVTQLAPIRSDDDGAGSGRSRVSFNATASQQYCIAVDGKSPAASGAVALSWSLATSQGSDGLFSAVLPGTRSVQIGQTATAFGTVINTGTAASKCYLQPAAGNSFLGEFSFRAVTPANAIDPAFGVNESVDVHAGGTRSFVFAITPRSEYEGVDVSIQFDCENKLPAPETAGVNSFVLTATSTPGPDVIPIAGTLSGDGIVNISGAQGTGVFSAAAVNIGAGSAIQVSATAPSVLGLQLSVCETNPTTGVCLAPPAPTISRTIPTDAIATYAVFAQSTVFVPFNPGFHRIALEFRDAANILRGATSVAVRTQ